MTERNELKVGDRVATIDRLKSRVVGRITRILAADKVKKYLVEGSDRKFNRNDLVFMPTLKEIEEIKLETETGRVADWIKRLDGE